MAKTSILDDGVFPIMGWAGPSDEMIRSDVMRGMAEAGFTISHSSVSGGLDQVKRALDVAAESNVRLMLGHADLYFRDELKLSKERRGKVARLVRGVQEHPGLYGYSLCDEPRLQHLPALARTHNMIRELDPYHLCYMNHLPPVEGCGAATAEAFWHRYIELTNPQMLSYDHYPIMVGGEAELQAKAGQPNVFPREKLIVKPDFFSSLELLRNLSIATGIPTWAFTCSVRHGRYPTPTEGHMRFQLMNALAYGARGLQYFTYAYDRAMVLPDGSTTETWEIARRINSDLHALAPQLRELRNIGVFRTGPLWSGTQWQHGGQAAPRVEVGGDPATIGFFQDKEEMLYLLVVNGSPCDWARVTIKVNPPKPDDKVYCFDVNTKAFGELWPPDHRNQWATLAPGEGRLFKIGGSGRGVAW